MVRVAINGFGRIGRLAFRSALLRHADQVEIVAVNTSGSVDTEGWMNLVKFDTNYGIFPKEIHAEPVKSPKETTEADPLIGYIVVEGKKYPVLAQKDPEKIPWGQYNVDVVIESTGIFIDQEGAGKHLKGGAKRVVISAPGKDENIKTYVLGVNETGNETVVSNASCTTNCISPVAQVIYNTFGIKKAMMTTVHAYTDDQRLQDNSHKDPRRARTAAANIIPTTTGAAIATTEVIPELKGLFDGLALRVPVTAGSISDLVFITGRETSIDEVNQAFEKAALDPRYAGILAITRDPIVSSDIVGQEFSCIVDLNFTNVVGGDMVKVLAWYDNEWGYTTRLVQQAIAVGQKIA